MGFSAQKYRREHEQRPWKIHPVWRGIGCALLILVLIMSWYGTKLFLQSNEKIVLPRELTRVVSIPYTHVSGIDRLIGEINNYFSRTGFVFGQIFFTTIFAIIGFGVMSVIYAVMYKVAGPPRYGPFDVPPNQMRR
jgi:hypothetical protein